MSLFTSGFCGIVLILRDGKYQRRTFGEQSHAMCPGSVAKTPCECNCHQGSEPWLENGEYVGHRAVVLEPLTYLEDRPHTHKKFTEVKHERKKPKPPDNTVADMLKALDELGDLDDED